MLWEQHDPAVQLRDRFGFPDAAAAGDWVARSVERHWGVRVEACERITMSSRNALAALRTPLGPLIAKWSVASDVFPRLSALATLTSWLERQRLPVSAPVAAVDGRLQVELDGTSIGLQRRIDGDLLDTADPAQLRAAGAVLARLHRALAAYPDAGRVADLVPHPKTPGTSIAGWLADAPGHLPDPACDVLRRLLSSAPGMTLPGQLVHGDIRSANVLCAESGVAAVLDFEEMRWDRPVVELARSAVLLGTRFRDWGPVGTDVHTALLEGYCSERPLDGVETHWWRVLVLWYSLLMIPDGPDPTGWRAAALRLSGAAPAALP